MPWPRSNKRCFGWDPSKDALEKVKPQNTAIKSIQT